MKIKYLDFNIDLDQEEKEITKQEFSFSNYYRKIDLAINHTEYIKEFLNSENNYNNVINSLNKVISETIDLGDRFEGNFSMDSIFPAKYKYYDKVKKIHQTYLIAVTEYIDIILKNRHLFKETFSLLKFTIHFYQCLQIIEEKKMVYLNLDKLVSYHTIDENLHPVLKALKHSKELIQLSLKANKISRTKVPVIALKYFYEGKIITRENGDELIVPYGYISGEGLYQDYVYYMKKNNRRANPNPLTKITFLNKIALFENVVKSLSDKYKSSALEDLNYLKANFKKEYE